MNDNTTNTITNALMDILHKLAGLGTGFFWGVLAFIAIFIPAVVIHEFGHLLMSRLCGVKIPEYGIGMPFTKRFAYFKKFGIIWSFYPLLLGGFVRIYGDNDAIDNAFDTHKTNPKLAKSDYQIQRLDEIITNRELEFFLVDNNLEFDTKWQNFEDLYTRENNSKNPLTDQEIANFDNLKRQLTTLIEWEYDTEINGNKKNTFFSKNWFQQTLIIMGGITFNILTAIICYSIIFSTFVLPKGISADNKPIPQNIDAMYSYADQVDFSYKSDYINFGVADDGFLTTLGITNEDKVYEIFGKKANDINSFTIDLKTTIRENKGKTVTIKYSKPNSDQIIEKSFVLENRLGIYGANKDVIFTSNKNSVLAGAGMVKNFVYLNFYTFGELFQGRGFDQVASPVKASNQIVEFASKSTISPLEFYLTLLAQISIALAVFNILPIPALDGGRLVILTLVKITGKRNRKLENTVISFTFLGLMGLGLIMVGRDSFDLIKTAFGIR